MAQIQPPETFDFSTPNEWPKWRKRFERYLVVSGMKKKEEADKIDLFMYLMGDRADDIFRTFKFEKEEEATKIDSVLKAFDSHFCVRKNIIYERAKFNSRIQEDREPVDEFITSLYKLADSCEFEGLHEQLIRDRIVVGVRDKALSERMQLDSELTLEKAVKMVRQQEAVRQQQVDLQRPSASQKVNQVKFNSKKQSPKQQQQPSRKKEKSAKTRSRCPKCGGFTHREGQACRAEGQRCNLCSKTGHFANCCPDKQAKTAEVKAVSELDEEIGFLLEVSAVEDSSNLDEDEDECRRRWTAEIQVNWKKVKFKLDSQADVTCVPLCLFKKIMGQQRLVESDINIRAAEFSELQTVGMFISTLRNGNYEIKEKIYVIRRLSEPLLSRRACELLNLARRIEVVATRNNPIKEFPEVFEGLGLIGNPYEIKLKPGAKPYAVHNPRRVPIPLMEKLKTRLEELEKAGIIAQVNVATEWCAPTVIAGKPNGDIRLCVDLSRLNEHVQREVHPMPVVEHMLGQLGEARFFSKLDANSGFHQIPLSPDCQHLTTFITPFGRYKYCRMPFGISLAPEYFQRVRSIILQGMDGVMCYLDDILIFASDSKTHDRILRLVLRKLKEAKVTLNKAKCVFGVPIINFLGHILDEDGIRPDPAKIEAVARMPAPTDVHGVRRFLGMVNHLGRKLRTTLPIAPGNLNPKLVDSQTLKRKEGRRRKDMKSRYDRRCGATDMEELSEGHGGQDTSATDCCDEAEKQQTAAGLSKSRSIAVTFDQFCFVERISDLSPVNYIKALEEKLGKSTVFQIMKMSGQVMVGLANMNLVDRFFEKGLTIGIFLLKASPSASGGYTWTTGNREAFVFLNEGLKLHQLPAKLVIVSKGESTPAYFTYGVGVANFHRQGHRRSICPLRINGGRHQDIRQGPVPAALSPEANILVHSQETPTPELPVPALSTSQLPSTTITEPTAAPAREIQDKTSPPIYSSTPMTQIQLPSQEKDFEDQRRRTSRKHYLRPRDFNDSSRKQRRQQRSSFDKESEFDKERIVAYRDCGLSFRKIGSRAGRNQTTVMRICDSWMQESTTDRRVRSHPPWCTLSRADRQIVRMAVTDRLVTSRTVAQHIQSVTHHPVSARTIRRRLQQSRLSARRPLLRLTLTQNHRRLRRQWCDERRMWTAEWNEIVFIDELRFCLQHHDGRIRVWIHRGERMLNSCVMHRLTGPAPGIMVWGGIGYHSRTPLVRIAGTLNS
ncbi:hypothetical protein LAZ67_16001621 [Cordylochernes scorpioides]|uniref:Reverse transcriptase domain-containing protein n=1 Tax=Cordylochernes scorpioides TaxID=51811 RepID=A0ABY6LCA9_9ARAC|nr:hypothetical protein LAZ67_16001621 [Cordylochernes scorpioides]